MGKKSMLLSAENVSIQSLRSLVQQFTGLQASFPMTSETGRVPEYRGREVERR